MIKHLYVNGCSNSCAIDPEEPGQNVVRPDDVYPGILRRKFNIEEYTNEALGGGSNNRIIRTTIKWITDNYIQPNKSTDELFVIIGWTQYLRKEFTWSKKEELKENSFIKEFYPFNRFWPGAMETNDDDFFIGKCKEYWRLWIAHGTNDMFEQTKWLHDIIGLESFFKQHNIKYLFVNTAAYFTFKELIPLASIVNKTRYYNMFDPDMETAHYRPNKVLFDKQFEKMFDIGWNGHFGSDFHKHFATLLEEYINDNNII